MITDFIYVVTQNGHLKASYLVKKITAREMARWLTVLAAKDLASVPSIHMAAQNCL